MFEKSGPFETTSYFQRKQLENQTDKFQAAQIDSEQLKIELQNKQEALISTKNQIDELTHKIKQQDQTKEQLIEQLTLVKSELDDARANLLGLDEEITELTNIVKLKIEKMTMTKLDIQKLTHELEKSQNVTKNLKTRLDEIISEHEWVMDNQMVNNIMDQYPNIDIEETREQWELLQEKFSSMRRKVNVNIMSMIENVEKKETSLKTMVKTIEKDKNKIVNTINKLNGYKRDTLNTTYQKVSKRFWCHFADLLPGSFAKLVPIDMMDVTKGLEVKVKLGQVWKESLVELSGGQRSLIALFINYGIITI